MLRNKIVVSIPIALESRDKIASALYDRYGTDYVFLGRFFRDRLTDKFCLIDIEDYHQTTVSLNISDLNKPTNQSSKIIYLTSDDVGYDACLTIARFAQIFLNIGGAKVNVDSTGAIRDQREWLENYDSQDVFDIYSLFVTLVEGDNYYSSSGMKNFGLADVSTDLSEDTSLAIYVMNVFNYYRLTDSVMLKDGQTFQPDFECPLYMMQWKECLVLETDDLLYNVCGRWHLSRVTEDLEISYQIN